MLADGDQHDNIGYEQQNKADQGQEPTVCNHQELQDIGLSASKLDDEGEITENAVYNIWTTER
jgi:hypothetical protein